MNASSQAPRSRMRRTRRAKAAAARSKRSMSCGPAGCGGAPAGPAMAATQTSIVYDEALGHHRRARLLALEPHGDEPGPQRPLERLGRDRCGDGEQLPHPVEVVADHAVGEVVARRRPADAGDQQAGRRVEVQPVAGLDLHGRAGRGERARRHPVGAREGARERGQGAVAGRGGGLRGRGGAAAELPGGALQQQPAPERDRRLPGGGGEHAVEVVAGEVRSLGQLPPVGARLVERVEHEIDQLAQAVGHRHMVARVGG